MMIVHWLTLCWREAEQVKGLVARSHEIIGTHGRYAGENKRYGVYLAAARSLSSLLGLEDCPLMRGAKLCWATETLHGRSPTLCRRLEQRYEALKAERARREFS